MNKVLLFEDNPINCRLITMFLEQAGYSTDTVNTVTGLNDKAKNEYKAILVDVSSPILSKEIVSDFLGSKISAPVITIMNNKNDDDIIFYTNAGARGYLIKPISIKTIKEALDSLSQTAVNSGNESSVKASDVQLVNLEQVGNELGLKDIKMLSTIFQQFFTSADNELAQIDNALANKDFKTLKELAHSIKGSSRNLRITLIGDIAEKLEFGSRDQLDKGTDIDFTLIINELKQIFALVHADFKKRYMN